MRCNSCISWQISFKFCMAVYLGKNLYASCFWWWCAQCSVFYRVKVHILEEIYLRAAGHISWRISFKFCIDVHHSQPTYSLYDAALSVPAFIGSKVLFLFTFLCALFQLRFLTDFVKLCMDVYLSKIYTLIVFGDAAPSVPSLIGSKVIFKWTFLIRSAGHIY